jgi:hypothetical protein
MVKSDLTRKPFLGGKHSMVDTLFKITCFEKNIFFSVLELRGTLSELVSTRRSLVLILPLQYGFPGFMFVNLYVAFT